MGKRWIITIIILVAVSFLLWGQARRAGAVDDRFYYNKILRVLNQVVENQQVIIQEIQGLKGSLKGGQ